MLSNLQCTMFLFALGLMIVSCQSISEKTNEKPVLIKEATSFDGQPLYRRQVDEGEQEDVEDEVAEIRRQPNLEEEDFIRIGKLYTSIYRYGDAIDVYQEGLNQYQDSYRLHRLKGHRHLSIRELTQAITHLSQADQLIGREDNGDLEYDDKDQPTGTYKYWVTYYSGVYYMLTDDLNNAIKCYQSCLELATSNKNTVGPSVWLYHLNQIKGRPEVAQTIIDRIAENLDTDQGHPYFEQAMLFKGARASKQLMSKRPTSTEDWTIQDATVTFGVARYHAYNSDSTTYQALLDSILQTKHWNAWAYVMAEKDRVDREEE